MVTEFKHIEGGTGQLASSEASMYLCPARKRATVEFIGLVNTDTSARTCNVYLKRKGGTSRYFLPKALSIATGNAVHFDVNIKLATGDDIRGDASVASKVDYVVSGTEEG
jgi:hypothetical protein